MGDVVARSEIDLVGRLSVESGVRNDGLVLLDVEAKESSKYLERFDSMEQTPVVFEGAPEHFDDGVAEVQVSLRDEAA